MDNIGLKRGHLELLDYREDYLKIYEEEKEELLKIYNNRIFAIEHIGSTSIKNIKSKPIIDILIQTNDLDDFINFTESNVKGDIYSVKTKSQGGYLIRKEEDDKVKAFIHVYKTGDINAKECILFRDYLNSHENERQCYERIKIELYNKYKNDRKLYGEEKEKYIREVINKAKKQKIYEE